MSNVEPDKAWSSTSRKAILWTRRGHRSFTMAPLPAALLDQRLPRLRAEGPVHNWQRATDLTLGALHVLACNMKRLMHILGVGGLIEAIRA